MNVYNWNPSEWTEGDWAIVERHGNTWTITPPSGVDHISVDGGMPIPWDFDLKFYFENRMAVYYEVIER